MLIIWIAFLVGTHDSLCASALLEDKRHIVKRDTDREKNMV